MPLKNQSVEIQRLLLAFEDEASEFHDISLSTYLLTQDGKNIARKFSTPNRVIMLWQYYGRIGAGNDSAALMDNIKESELGWGLKGAETSCFALFEGQN